VADLQVSKLTNTNCTHSQRGRWATSNYNGFVDDHDLTMLGAFYDPNATPIGPSVTSGDSGDQLLALFVSQAVHRKSRNG
jgi:hypothetical protein